jgi:predicted secreted protein
MIQDKRSHKIVIVAHCILNQNSRVQGKAHYAGIINEIIDVIRKNEVGIIQMPCPELTYAGLLRPSQTKEQYDTPAFRRHCRQIASSTADQVEEYVGNGFKVLAILGVEGSPTCGVGKTSIQEANSGILVEELRSELMKRKVEVIMKGVRHAYASQGAQWLEKNLIQDL